MDQGSDNGRYHFSRPPTGDQVFPSRPEMTSGEQTYDVYVQELRCPPVEFVASLVRQGMSTATAERVAQTIPCAVKRGVAMAVATQYKNVFEHAGGSVDIVEVLARGGEGSRPDVPSHAAETMVPPSGQPMPSQPSHWESVELPTHPHQRAAESPAKPSAESLLPKPSAEALLAKPSAESLLPKPSAEALLAKPGAAALAPAPGPAPVDEFARVRSEDGLSIGGLGLGLDDQPASADEPSADIELPPLKDELPAGEELTPDMVHHGPSAEFMPLPAQIITPAPAPGITGRTELDVDEVHQPRSQYEHVGKAREEAPDFKVYKAPEVKHRNPLIAKLPTILICAFVFFVGTYTYGCVDVTSSVSKFNSNLSDLNRRLENMNARNRVVTDADIEDAVGAIAKKAGMKVTKVEVIADPVGTVRLGPACQFANMPDTINQLPVSERQHVMKSPSTCSIPDYILTIKVEAKARFLYVTRSTDFFRVTYVNKYQR